MKLTEAINHSGIPLEEATLTQIAKRINKHKADAASPSDLAKLLAADNALKQSLGTVSQGTPEEKEAFASLIQDAAVSKAIGILAEPLKKAISRLANVPVPGTDAPARPAARVAGALASMPDKDKSIIQAMQKDFMKANTPSDKEELVRKWTSSTYNAKLYKLANKEGII